MTKNAVAVIGSTVMLLFSAPLHATETSGSGVEKSDRGLPCSAATVPFAPSTYYGIDLVSTRRVPGTGIAKGIGRVTFAKSPFGVSISPEGSYVYDLSLSIERLKPPRNGVYTAWISKPDLDEIERIGVFDEKFELSDRVEWNKFLIVVTLEPSAEEAGDTWRGPVIMRGMSRSGMMHTLAGHGPFVREPCSKYGYR